MKIDKIEISETSPVFIIAELSANHNHDFDIAMKTIKAAKDVGADAIKLQTYTPDTITIDCDNDYFKIKQNTIWDGMTLYELYKKAYTPWDWQPKLKKFAEELGLVCFSSPFDKSAVDFLEKLNVPAYKIASPEITDIPLIRYIAKKHKPVIFSTGLATKEDLDLAIKTCEEEGNKDIILLKCTSAYPTPLNEVNLLTLKKLKKDYSFLVGISDHTLGIDVPIASVALGAKVIEKHFILDKKIGGPDSSFSLNPDEFSLMVKSVRNVEKALGKETYELSKQAKNVKDHRRSLFIVKDVNKNDLVTEENTKSIRPGFGLHPQFYNQVIGKKFKLDFKKGTPLSLDLIY